MKNNTLMVVDYLEKNRDKQLTAADVANKLGLTKRQVDGIFTAELQKKGRGKRILAQRVEGDVYVNVKYLTLLD